MCKKLPNLGKTKFNTFKKFSQSQTQLKQQNKINKQTKSTELFKKENLRKQKLKQQHSELKKPGKMKEQKDHAKIKLLTE